MCAVSTSVVYVNPLFDPNDCHLDSSTADFADIDLLVVDTTAYSGHVPLLKMCKPKATTASKNTPRIRLLILIVGTVLLCAMIICLAYVDFTLAHNHSS